MQAPQLNVDVLAVACEFLADISDVLSVSLTCSSVHVVFVRWLLLTRPVYLKSGSSIQRFHSFLLADEPARAPHVRALDINLAWPPPVTDDCPLLLKILDSCQNLEHITVAFQNQDASFSTVADPRFLQAVDAIPCLRSFNIRGISIDPLGLLARLRAPVSKLGLHASNLPLSARHPAVLEEFLPRVVLRTLRELELDQFIIDLEDDPLPPANPPIPPILEMRPYPAVRSLSVSLRGRPLLDCLQHLFPALDGTLELGGLHMRHVQETYAEIRAANQRSQLEDSERDADGSSPSHPWKKLDRVVCDAPMFYALGLRCPVRLAMLDFGLVKEHGRYVADALRENPVPHLKLAVEHELDAAFGALFSAELAGTLTHLTLCLYYSNSYGSEPSQGIDRRWDGTLDAIVSAVRPLRKLTHLRVVVGVTVHVTENAPWPFAPWEEYAHTFRPSRFDFEGVASTLARALPSLQYIFLTTGGFLSNWDEPAYSDMEDPEGARGRWTPYERWFITHGWRVANPGSGTGRVQGGEDSLVRLHDDVAETVIRNEELVVSKHDETALHLRYAWGLTPPPLSVP